MLDNVNCSAWYEDIPAPALKRKSEEIHRDPSLCILSTDQKRRRSDVSLGNQEIKNADSDRRDSKDFEDLKDEVERNFYTPPPSPGDAAHFGRSDFPDQLDQFGSSDRPDSTNHSGNNDRLESPDQSGHTDNRKFKPSSELKELLQKLPTIKGTKKLATLVEVFQRENPKIKITNLYDMTYEVDSIVKCKLVNNDFKLLVRWDGCTSDSDSWQPEAGIRQMATPALALHLCEFFLRGTTRKSYDYFGDYIQRAVLESDCPDYFVLCRLADEELFVRNDRVLLPTNECVDRMRKRATDLLRKKDYESLLRNFGNSLRYFISTVEIRQNTLDCNAAKTVEIAAKHSNDNIKIENLVDCEKFPSDFEYITENRVHPEVIVIPPGKICQCRNGCLGAACCGTQFYNSKPVKPYRSELLTRECHKVLLYECNKHCSCGPECGNRLIQNGSKVKLTIFKTLHRGWGVKARRPISKGAFIGEYVGEVITSDEAASRQAVNFTYLFDLVPSKNKKTEITVDAADFGNFTRFFNHSCNPNMAVSYVLIDNHNPLAPRLAFFATKDIQREEELTFDYKMQPTGSKGELYRMKCHCKAAKCKGYLF